MSSAFLRSHRRPNTPSVGRGARTRLRVDLLEERLAPAVFNVLNADDSGVGSFRQAIADANGVSTSDTINFDNLFFNQARTISLLSALPVISDSVVVNGVGAGTLTVRRDPGAGTDFRIFEVNGPGTLNVTISGMTITGGNPTGASGSGPIGDGGGVLLFNENLTLLNMVVTGNTSGTEGGGVAVANLASGGAGFLTVRNSTISGNTANGSPNPSFGGGGGGIYFANRGSLLLENSTVSGNTSTNFTGGGIYFFGVIGAGGFTIRNSTISGNTAATSGGGLYLGGITTTANVQNSTFIGNTANGTLATQGGGGIGFFRLTGAVSLVSSVVANNTIAAGGTGADYFGRVNQSFSLIRDEAGATITDEGSNLLGGTDPMLDPAGLSNNGGPTQTIALQAASPLINAGSNPGSQAFDQRGSGFPRAVGQPDIGAYEFLPAGTPAASGTFANVTTTGVTSYAFQVTYTSPTSPINTGTLDNNDIRVQGPNGFNVLATRGTFDASNPNVVVVNYSVPAPGGAFTPGANGGYSISVEQSQVENNIPVSVPAGAIGSFQVLVPSAFVVTNADDSGTGSLRDAIAQANATSTADAITFGPLFTTAQTITLTTDQLLITDAATITGPGAGLLTIRRDPAAATQFRIFEINVAGSISNVSLSGMTITGGTTGGTSGSGADGDGGGILLYNENVTLDGVVVTNNTSGTEGGGIAVASFTNPSGGSGFLTLRNSAISGNSAIGAIGGSGFGGGGGGLYFANGGSLLVENSTISGNVSTNFEGGGLYFFGPVGADGLTLRNSTIAGNSAGTNGGGMNLVTINVTALIQNCTIANNFAGGTLAGDGGGGIGFFSATGALAIANSVIANNTVSVLGTGPDLAGPATFSFSLIRDQSGAILTDGGDNLAPGIDPLFAAAGLANNGGPTQTIALQAASPLINEGPATVPGIPFDQRGAPNVRVSGAASDIGAFEVQGGVAAPTVLSTLVNNSTGNQRSRVSSLAVTFSTAVSFAGAVANAFTLVRNGNGAIVNFTATTSVNGQGQTVVILDSFVDGTAGVTQFGSLADGNYTLTALANQISAGGTPMAANYVFGSVPADRLYRYYGDVTGDRRVDIADFGFFSAGYLQGPGANVPALDFNQDGRLDITDFGQFSVRFFTTLP